MAEHGLDGSQQVLGFAFDGTGYGSDGAVWGGEVLLANYKGYERLAQLSYVPLAGGDISVLRPYRMALAHLWAAGIAWEPDLPPVAACPAEEQRVLRRQLETDTGCVPTSSMGRLFDAVSALIGVRQVVAYEAQAAIELEGLSRGVDCAKSAYAFEVHEGVIDPTPVLKAVLRDHRDDVPPGLIGARFHQAVADLIVGLADRERDASPTVALSGGVFQNALLLQLTVKGLQAKGLDVITHRAVPPNDGGVALGQLMVGNSE
jgi:hydrogenase maturation protein HypF